MTSAAQLAASPWPHRWAVVLACATFPLVWVGGLVTTTDAGMAVPDWPTTYGYNLFLYPWQTWLSGPWDLFVEHGHRLLAAMVGMIAMGLVAVFWRCESRRWVRGLGWGALALVIAQGVLGGMRVLLNERSLAMFHGCTGPLFFALCVTLAVVTSNRWQQSNGLVTSPTAPLVRWLAVAVCVLVYLQIVLGAVLRHVPVDGAPATFAMALRFHLAMAAVVTIHIGLLAWLVHRYFRAVTHLHRLSMLLAALVALQLALGAATWVVKFSVPVWASSWWPGEVPTTQAGGWFQAHMITAHVAGGSLVLAAAVALALAAMRQLAAPVAGAHTNNHQLKVAT